MQQSLFASMIANPDPVSQEAPALSYAPASLPTSLDTLLEQGLFTVIDLETTGLNAKKNAITEITAIQFENGVEKAKYSTLVKPAEPIPPEVESITGISNEMVAGAPALVMVLSELCGFVGSNPLIVGHNVSFDLGFLREKLDQSGLATFVPRFEPKRSFCTKILAQRIMPGLPSYEGVVVANHCGVHNPNPHRAEHDVRMSAGILFALIERLKKNGKSARTVGDLLAVQGEIGL